MFSSRHLYLIYLPHFSLPECRLVAGCPKLPWVGPGWIQHLSRLFAQINGKVFIPITFPYVPWDWIFYLHGWLIIRVNVGKCAIHEFYGFVKDTVGVFKMDLFSTIIIILLFSWKSAPPKTNMSLKNSGWQATFLLKWPLCWVKS